MANTDLHEHAPHLSVTEARQAQRGRHVLMVLIASVGLAALVLVLAWSWKSEDLHHADTSSASRIAAASPQISSNPAAPPATGAGTPAANDLSK